MQRIWSKVWGFWGAAAILSSVGCASSRALTCPGEISSVWKEIESAHFRVITNRPLDEARIALADFEETYDVFTNVVMSGEIPEPVPIRVVLFDKESEFATIAPRGAGAFFKDKLPLDAEPTPTLVMWGDLVAEARLTFQHELTHHMFRKALGPVPPWLSEGLAEYYSTLRIDGGEVFMGELQPQYDFYLNPDWQATRTGGFVLVRIPVGDIPKADQLMAMDRATFYEQANQNLDENGEVPMEENRRRTTRYAGSWALVHMLAHSPAYGERWQEFMTALVAGKGYSAALEQSYGPVMESIPNAHHDYLIIRQRTAVKTKYTPKTRACPKDERPLSPSKVKLVFAQLRPSRGRTSKDDVDPEILMQGDLNAAIELAPTSGDGFLYRGLFSLQAHAWDDAAKDLESAYQESPDDQNVVIGVARMCLARMVAGLPDLPFCEKNIPIVRARLVKSAKTPYTHFLASTLLLLADQPDEAFGHAKQAVKIDPGCVVCLDHLGTVLHDRGNLREAIVFKERAVAALPETASSDALLKRIREYRQELIEAAKAQKKEGPP